MIEPYYDRDGITIYHGDCLESLRQLPDESVNCCITSPPYWGLRDYGHEGQLGLEKTPEEYVTKMVEVFREVRRVLRDDGTVWLNLGDCYATNGVYIETYKANHPEHQDLHTKHSERYQNKKGSRDETVKAKDLIGMPWRVAFALQADGWYLRQDIIWNKPNPMPESVTDRCTKSHEYIFLLAKSQKYFYDHEAIKEAATYQDPRMVDGFVPKSDNGKHAGLSQSASIRHKNMVDKGQQPNSFHMARTLGYLDEIYPYRNKRSVWTVTTSSFPEAHFATFPEDLIEPMVKAGCPEGGIILDPFAGSGTSLVVAKKWNRQGIGLELNEKYCEIAVKRIEAIPPNLPFEETNAL